MMIRKMLVVGDAPILGGQILPYEGPGFEIHGHRAALIGGRAYCHGCNSVGIIAKSGGPSRLRFISEVALEHDVVVCHCPTPQLLISSLQETTTYDHGGGLAVSISSITTSPMFDSAGAETAAMKKVVDGQVVHALEAELTEKICPNMTNKEFAVLAMSLRDMAIEYIGKKRLPELARWDEVARIRVKTWFGVADQATREYLQRGLVACSDVLSGLQERNFVRFAEDGKLVTCVMGATTGVAAAVCKPDTMTHTIAIGLDFCEFEYDNRINFNTKMIVDGDSRLLTLLHEITHFNDTFGSDDIWYGTRNSRKNATRDARSSKINADSLAAYILGVVDE